MPSYCENDGCENEAEQKVPVSMDEGTIEYRHYCQVCSEVYHVGAQHGYYRSKRQLRDWATKVQTEASGLEPLPQNPSSDERRLFEFHLGTARTINTCASYLNPSTDPGEEGLTPPPLELEEEDDEDFPGLFCTRCDQMMVVNGDGTTNHLCHYGADGADEVDEVQDDDHVATAP